VTVPDGPAPVQRRPGSLGTRLLVISALLLVAAFGITIAVLDYIFRSSAEQAIGDQLEAQVFALIGAAEPDDEGELSVPRRLLEPRLRNPGSGLYAEILDGAGLPLWRSPSAVGMDLAAGEVLQAGQRTLVRRVLGSGDEVLLLGLGINWELGPEAVPAFQVFAASELAPYREQVAQFRRQLLGWFSGVMFVLLAALWLALRSGLAPLRRMADEIARIERGEREQLGDHYPRELEGVGRGLNMLLRAERQRMERYRTTMDDLAHSLKTPIAVLRSELGAQHPDSATLRTQVERMQGVIDYQLRRAAATGPRSLAARAVLVAPVISEVAGSLRKIHRDRQVECTIRVADGMQCRVEQGDLYEIVGNLLDNAWKWCSGRVEVSATRDGGGFVLQVTDDGPGIPDTDADAVLGRGIRANQRGDVPGQGIGLAVVREIVELYGGRVAIRRGALGGAEVSVSLPAAAATA
jgi:two-component system sensor histidine kinase PhoQ